MKPRLPRAGDLDRATIAVDTRLRPLVERTAQPGPRRALHIAALVAALAIVAAFSLGVVMLATMLHWWYVAIGVVVLAVVVDLVPWRPVQVFLIGLVAAAVAVMGLLGVDVIWAALRLERPDARVGLAIAAVVVTAFAYAYLRWVGSPPPPHHLRWALLAAASGLGLAWITREQVPQLRLVATAAAVGVATLIYLRRAAGARIRRPLSWALLLAGVAVIAAPLLWEAVKGKHTDVVLLLVGAVGAVVAGINGLWARQGTEARRLARWGVGTGVVIGVGIPLFVFGFARLTAGEPRPPEERMLPVPATASPLPQRVIDHRPILLFDSGEEFRTPLDVDAMLETSKVELCPEGTGPLAHCPTVDAAADLRGGFGNLRFDTQQIEDEHLPTTIYAHEVPDKLHQGWTDVDYWWYLPDNPARTAQGAMCGAGFVIPEITCFDHQSDWEGAIVVLDGNDMPRAVRYAAHDHVVDVPWPLLQDAVKGKQLRPYAQGRDVANRPLVFVARGTHAAYPLPCRASICDSGTPFEDNRHDGRFEWPERECSPSGCVTPFPRSQTGADASWNAFDGRWGSAACVTKGFVCTLTNAPMSPGQQHRYDYPWCYDLAVKTDLRRFAKGPECPKD